MKKLYLILIALFSTASILPMASLTRNVVKTSQKLAPSLESRKFTEYIYPVALCSPLIINGITNIVHHKTKLDAAFCNIELNKNIENPIKTANKSLRWSLLYPSITTILLSSPTADAPIDGLEVIFLAGGSVAMIHAINGLNAAIKEKQFVNKTNEENELAKKNSTATTPHKFNFMKDEVQK